MTALEALFLRSLFDETTDRGGSYFHSSYGPSDTLTLGVDELRTAYDGSRDRESPINEHVASLLAEHDGLDDGDRREDIYIDLTEPGIGWPEIFQAIVFRSIDLKEIVVTTAFTCTKMRPDGFGGSVMRITADAIQYSSTEDMLLAMYDAPAGNAADDDGHETRGRIEAIAADAGWDSFTLLLLIARWLDSTGSTAALVSHLDALAACEDEGG